MFFPRVLPSGRGCRGEVHCFALACMPQGDRNGPESQGEKHDGGRLGHRRHSGLIQAISSWNAAIKRLCIFTRSKRRGSGQRLELEGSRPIPLPNPPIDDGESPTVVFEMKKPCVRLQSGVGHAMPCSISGSARLGILVFPARRQPSNGKGAQEDDHELPECLHTGLQRFCFHERFCRCRMSNPCAEISAYRPSRLNLFTEGA